jgi:PAS domain S-box-containing protein
MAITPGTTRSDHGGPLGDVFVHAFVHAGLFGVYVLAGKLSLSLAFVHASASAVWPPTGIALAALLILGDRAWPAIFAGAFVVNVTTAGSVATSLGIASGNTLEGLLGAYLVNRFACGARAFERAPDAFKFAGLAAGLSTMVSATMGVGSLAVGGYARWAEFGSIWTTWWLGDAVGALIVAPVVVLWVRNPRPDVLGRQPLEAAGLLIATIVVGLMVFADGLAFLGLRALPLTFLCAAPLVWAKFRFRPREAATVTAVLSGIAIWGTLRGAGPFVAATESESLLLLQVFMGTVSMMIMPAAAVVEERRRVEHEHEALLARAQVARADAESLIKNAPDPVFVSDLEGKILQANDAVFALLGFRPDELIEQSLSRIISADETREFLAALREVVERGVTRNARLNPRSASGEIIPTTLNASALRDADGEVIGAIGILRDMRAYERAVRDLQASQTELQRKILDLEKFEEVVVGRELKMIALEKELEAARRELARLRAQVRLAP